MSNEHTAGIATSFMSKSGHISAVFIVYIVLQCCIILRTYSQSI